MAAYISHKTKRYFLWHIKLFHKVELLGSFEQIHYFVRRNDAIKIWCQLPLSLGNNFWQPPAKKNDEKVRRKVTEMSLKSWWQLPFLVTNTFGWLSTESSVHWLSLSLSVQYSVHFRTSSDLRLKYQTQTKRHQLSDQKSSVSDEMASAETASNQTRSAETVSEKTLSEKSMSEIDEGSVD